MADEDPMAYLAAKRQQLAAMSQATEVARLQSELAVNVQKRMAAIERLTQEAPREDRPLVTAPGGLTGDQEVDFWRQRIAALSSGQPQVHVSRSGSVAISPGAARQQYQPAPAAYGGGASAAYGGGSSAAYGAAPSSQVHVSRTGSVDIRGQQYAPQMPHQAPRGFQTAAPLGYQAPAQRHYTAQPPPRSREYGYSAPAARAAPAAPPAAAGGSDPEGDYWRQKIAALSVAGTSPVAGSSGGASAQYAVPARQQQQQQQQRQQQQPQRRAAPAQQQQYVAPAGYGYQQRGAAPAAQIHASRTGSIDIRPAAGARGYDASSAQRYGYGQQPQGQGRPGQQRY